MPVSVRSFFGLSSRCMTTYFLVVNWGDKIATHRDIPASFKRSSELQILLWAEAIVTKILVDFRLFYHRNQGKTKWYSFVKNSQISITNGVWPYPEERWFKREGRDGDPSRLRTCTLAENRLGRGVGTENTRRSLSLLHAPIFFSTYSPGHWGVCSQAAFCGRSRKARESTSWE